MQKLRRRVKLIEFYDPSGHYHGLWLNKKCLCEILSFLLLLLEFIWHDNTLFDYSWNSAQFSPNLVTKWPFYDDVNFMVSMSLPTVIYSQQPVYCYRYSGSFTVVLQVVKWMCFSYHAMRKIPLRTIFIMWGLVWTCFCSSTILISFTWHFINLLYFSWQHERMEGMETILPIRSVNPFWIKLIASHNIYMYY